MNLGLTGGIATGKSTVSQMLVKRGAVLIDADQIAREVVLPGSEHLAEISQIFGQAVIAADGTLDRTKLGSIVFNNERARKQLEAILHPAIRKQMLSRMDQYATEQPDRLVVVDVPLLFESGLQQYFEEIMLVYVPEKTQLARLRHRDGFDEIEAQARIDAQMPIEQKKQLADVVIDNSGTLEQTEAQVDRFWRRKHKR